MADGQRGLVTHAQLQRLGLSRKMIETRRRSGYLRPLHRGVYAVGHVALAPFGSELAAVLACSPSAWLSHHAAARLWGVIEASTVPEVTVVGRNCGSKEGIVVHRVATLPAVDLTRREGIPVTSLARTLVDLAPSLSPRQLERAFDEGRVRGVIGAAALEQALARYPHCRGAVGLTSLLDEGRATTITRADSEERMLALIRRAALPAAEMNVQLGRWSVDFLWRAQGVAVELDSYGFHTTRSAFERDREKDHAMRAMRIELLRFTYRQLVHQREITLVRLATALAHAS